MQAQSLQSLDTLGLSADGRNCANPSAKQLVSLPSPDYLKVECLVVLSLFSGREQELECDLALSRDHPTKLYKPVHAKNKQIIV